MRKEQEGEDKRCHPCLNFVLCGGKLGGGGAGREGRVYFGCCHHLSPAFNLPHCSSLVFVAGMA